MIFVEHLVGVVGVVGIEVVGVGASSKILHVVGVVYSYVGYFFGDGDSF